jgi:hypothetical protein
MAEGGAWPRQARRLLARLEAERGLLRAGRLGELARQAGARDRLVEALAGEGVPEGGEARALALRLRAAAALNLRLLAAAREGLAAARRGLARRGAEPTGIGLYGAAGGRAEPAPAARTDRRA